ncbi:MAG: DUF1080 domain-containing protein [Capsulimonadales bacterium]|nr:DUF1080 domain-containing protein [Capsulimonadales bacterium]
MRKTYWQSGLAVCALLATIGVVRLVLAGELPKMSQNLGYDDTPFLPYSKYRVHDGQRPQPEVVTPAYVRENAFATPPSDAVVLFDGKDLSRWRNGNGEAIGWKLVDGEMEVVRGTGDIFSRDEFGDCQLHLEWRAPEEVRGSSQGRSNSGLFFFGVYEIQILDNYDNPTYADGIAGSVYGQYPPLVNACRKPGEWQSYDVLFTAPRFKDGKVEKPAYVTVIHNGVVVQNHTELIGMTNHRAVGEYKPHAEKGPIKLQDHGDPVRFRNIWVRPLKGLPE